VVDEDGEGVAVDVEFETPLIETVDIIRLRGLDEVPVEMDVVEVVEGVESLFCRL
jgi:hypothetical protein